VGAKDNSYHELVYKGPSAFVGAVKLVHTKGYMSNHKGEKHSYWGITNSPHLLATVITDAENRIIYPSTRVTQLTWHGLYRMPGYNITVTSARRSISKKAGKSEYGTAKIFMILLIITTTEHPIWKCIFICLEI
jgi:hypothetical protein